MALMARTPRGAAWTEVMTVWGAGVSRRRSGVAALLLTLLVAVMLLGPLSKDVRALGAAASDRASAWVSSIVDVLEPNTAAATVGDDASIPVPLLRGDAGGTGMVRIPSASVGGHGDAGALVPSLAPQRVGGDDDAAYPAAGPRGLGGTAPVDDSRYWWSRPQ
jgi:hypothetical protein